MRCEYAHDDGAYVLGALSPAERAAFERHMADCLACREAVAEIAVIPGLLGRLDPVAARQLLGTPRSGFDPAIDDDDAGPPRPALAVVAGGPASAGEPRVTALVTAAAEIRRRERRKRRLRNAGLALAAACLALIAGIGIGVVRGNGLPGGDGNGDSVRLSAMSSVSGEKLPVSAEIGLTAHQWGTEVTMHCWYEHTGEYHGAWTFRLVAVGPDDVKEQIGSWIAGPGDDLTFTMPTRFNADQLTRLEITKADGTPLLVRQLI
ncbi:MAG TPA: zf-HC2 domain-containing protein [Pilimelia sp.]|nr:zf-HC2 domain-containing protein [Pilimelia sp.]